MELVTTQQGTAASALSFHWQRRHRCRPPIRPNQEKGRKMIFLNDDGTFYSFLLLIAFRLRLRTEAAAAAAVERIRSDRLRHLGNDGRYSYLYPYFMTPACDGIVSQD